MRGGRFATDDIFLQAFPGKQCHGKCCIADKWYVELRFALQRGMLVQSLLAPLRCNAHDVGRIGLHH